MDGVVAGYADHEGFASPFRHEFGPHGLCRSGSAEVGEFADVVNNNIARLLADLTFPASSRSGSSLRG